jgi:hypothetical protein
MTSPLSPAVNVEQMPNPNIGILPLRKKNTYKLDEILSDQTTAPKHIVERGILVPGGITLLHGKPKTRKSFLAIQLGMNIASGSPFLGFNIPQKKNVLIIQAELNFYAIKGRVQKMILNKMMGGAHRNLTITDCLSEHVDNDEQYAKLKSMILREKAEVVIIDPLVFFHGSSENSNDEMGNVMSRFRSLVVETGISLILVHHDGKSFDLKGGDSSRGASSIFGAVDTDISIGTATKGKTHPIHQWLNFSMRHSRTPDSFRIYFDDESLTFSTTHVTSDLAKLLQVVSDHPSAGKKYLVTKTEEAIGCGKSKAYSLIKGAIASGDIELDEAGNINIPNSEL